MKKPSDNKARAAAKTDKRRVSAADKALTKAQLVEELSRFRRENARLVKQLAGAAALQSPPGGKNADALLREHPLFLEQLINSIPSPIFYKDGGGRYTGCNRAFEEFMGISLDDIRGKSVYDISPRALAEKYHEMDQRLFDHPGTQTYEAAVQTPGQGPRNVIFNKATFTKADGALGGLIGVITDITERKQAEQQIKVSLAEKEILLNEINHRVKNNLAILLSLVRLQTSQVKDSAARGCLENVGNRIRALSLIHERLNRSSDVTRIDVRDYIGSLAAEIYRSLVIDDALIKLELDVYRAMLDVNYLIPCGLIINELLTNALKYAFHLGEKGTVTIVFAEEGDKHYRLVIKDTGVGLPEGFDMWKAGGLGMKIVGSLVRQLNGEFEDSGHWRDGVHNHVCRAIARAPDTFPHAQTKRGGFSRAAPRVWCPM